MKSFKTVKKTGDHGDLPQSHSGPRMTSHLFNLSILTLTFNFWKRIAQRYLSTHLQIDFLGHKTLIYKNIEKRMEEDFHVNRSAPGWERTTSMLCTTSSTSRFQMKRGLPMSRMPNLDNSERNAAFLQSVPVCPAVTGLCWSCQGDDYVSYESLLQNLYLPYTYT